MTYRRPMKNPNCFPGTCRIMPDSLIKWRKRFKIVGKNIMVNVVNVDPEQTLGAFVRDHGHQTKIGKTNLLKPNTWRKATEKEIKEYWAGHVKYDAGRLAAILADADADYTNVSNELAGALGRVKQLRLRLESVKTRRMKAIDAFASYARANPDNPTVISVQKTRNKRAEARAAKQRAEDEQGFSGSESIDGQ